jgi:hypothetical protein
MPTKKNLAPDRLETALVKVPGMRYKCPNYPLVVSLLSGGARCLPH